MQIDNIQLNLDNYTVNYNSVKEVVLSRLLLDSIITEEVAQKYSENWQIIIIKNSWFKRWVSKFNKPQKEEYSIKYVKFED